VPAGAEMGIASLPGLGFGIPPAFMHPARDTPLRHDLAGEHVDAESLQAAALTAGEQFVTPPGRMNLGSPQGLSLLGRELVHTEHPLALRPLPEIANLLVAGTEHVAQLPEQVLHQVFGQELLPPPRMELRREAHATSALAQGQSHAGGFTGGDWSDQSGGEAVDHRVAATPHSVETPAAETPVGGDESAATVWQSAGAAPAGGAGSSGTELDSLARQVFALLQSQLRAERDRHQIYDR
jgi:hypothetical protein